MRASLLENALASLAAGGFTPLGLARAAVTAGFALLASKKEETVSALAATSASRSEIPHHFGHERTAFAARYSMNVVFSAAMHLRRSSSALAFLPPSHASTPE